MQVYLSWKPKHQLSVLIFISTMIIFTDHFPSLDKSTISSKSVKCFSIPRHAVPNFWRQANHQVWKKHYLILSSDRLQEMCLHRSKNTHGYITQTRKKKSKHFVLQHLTSWCIKALYTQWSFWCTYGVCKYDTHSEMEKLRNAGRVFLPIRNDFSQPLGQNMLFWVLKWKVRRNVHQNSHFPQIRWAELYDTFKNWWNSHKTH